MSIAVQSQVWERSQFNGPALLLLLAIADFADDEGYAFPSIGTLAKKIRCTPRNVNLIIERLKESRELEIQEGAGPKGTNRYRVKISSGVKKPSGVKFSAAPLKNSSSPPEESFPKPLKPASPKPSMNHHEPSKNHQRGNRGQKNTAAPAALAKRQGLKAFGELKAVKLTDVEYSDLQIRFPEIVNRLIGELDNYSRINPKTFKSYRDHYRVLLNWCGREVARNGSNGKSRHERIRDANMAMLRKVWQQGGGDDEDLDHDCIDITPVIHRLPDSKPPDWEPLKQGELDLIKQESKARNP